MEEEVYQIFPAGEALEAPHLVEHEQETNGCEIGAEGSMDPGIESSQKRYTFDADA